MEANKVKQIQQFGQRIWLDYIDRNIIDSGKLQKFIDEDGITGITSNPAIFEKAINSSNDYQQEIHELSRQKKSNEEIFYAMAIKDIQRAAGLFKNVYDNSNGADGYVSLEVSPHLARNTAGTVKQAMELWSAVNRNNVMIKIPGTAEGLPAITKCISEGININVTLLFGLPRYREVVEAYLQGLEMRLANKLPIQHIASVASFFLSRIDVLIDPVLDEKSEGTLKGEVAIASAKKAYEIYKNIFSSERFKRLESNGGKRQRLLWASTSSKNPDFSDTKYVEALIGPETVNTIPTETLDAFRDHGKAENNLEKNLDKANQVLLRLIEKNIDIDAMTRQLEDEGIDKFNKPYDKLLDSIQKQKEPDAMIR